MSAFLRTSPEKMRPLDDSSTHNTEPVCPIMMLVWFPEITSQRRNDLSLDAVQKAAPSLENTISLMRSVWPLQRVVRDHDTASQRLTPLSSLPTASRDPSWLKRNLTPEPVSGSRLTCSAGGGGLGGCVCGRRLGNARPLGTRVSIRDALRWPGFRGPRESLN